MAGLETEAPGWQIHRRLDPVVRKGVQGFGMGIRPGLSMGDDKRLSSMIDRVISLYHLPVVGETE